MTEFIQGDKTPTKLLIDTSGTFTDYLSYDLLFDPTIDPDTGQSFTRWSPFAEPVERDLAPNLFARAIVGLYNRGGSDLPLWIINLDQTTKFLASAFIDTRHQLHRIPRFLSDLQYRKRLNFSDDDTKEYWKMMDAKPPRERSSDLASTYNTFSSPLLDSRVRSLFDTSETKFSFAKIEGKTTIVRLPIPEYGVDTVKFIGSLVLAYTNYFADGWSIYVDDCDLFAKNTMVELYTRSNCAVTVAHQYLDQVNPDLLTALLGNSEEHYSFRMSYQDAKTLEPDRNAKTSRYSMLYELKNFAYRTLPYDKSPDRATVPLEIG